MSLTIEADDLLLFALTLDDCSREHIKWGEMLMTVEDRKGLTLWIETMQDIIAGLRYVRASEAEANAKAAKANKSKRGR